MVSDIKKIDELIQKGRLKETRSLLIPYRHIRPSREDALLIARVARRVGLWDLTLKLLNPIVRPSARSVLSATDTEKAVYAAALTRMGAAPEALELLNKVDAKQFPESLLYLSHALVSEWNYKASIPVLIEYLKCSLLNQEQRIIGELNLAAAFVHEQKKEAESLLDKLRKETKKLGLHQLYGNTLELSAQKLVLEKDFKEANRFIKEAETELKQAEGLDLFFVEKWHAISEMFQNPNKRSLLENIRKKAKILKHWETIRDCDRYECIIRKDKKLFLHLYFGTPYKEFREKLIQDMTEEIRIPSYYDWQLTKKTGKVANFEFKEGHVLDRLVKVLASDFYRPTRTATMFSRLFPGEFYSPKSAHDKIHQALKRLREEFTKKRISIHIIETNSAYFLQASKPMAVRVGEDSFKKDRVDCHLDKLKSYFSGKEFTIQNVINTLEVPQRTAARFLLDAVSRGELIRTGKAAKTKYLIKP